MISAPGGERFGRLELVAEERRLLLDGQPVALGSRAFDLLAALVARRDRIVAKEELIEVVWPGLVVEDNNLQVQISALRKVLGTNAIATVPGRGYRFTVAAGTGAPAAPALPASAATSKAGTTRPSRLLVADDNKVNRLLLCRSLELMGHDVATADNGRSALELLRRERFDLLLLDLEMPEIDGFGVLERRADDAALREVPVIVTSSLEGAASVARCIELGADDYLHKPVNPMLLQARVESSLEKKRLRDRQRELLARLAPGFADGSHPVGATPVARRVAATLLAARLGGLDAIAASESAPETIEVLSSWSTLMLDAVEEHGGLVSDIAGDGLTAAFGALAPVTGDGGAPWSAVRAGLEMLALTALFNAERAAAGKAQLALVVGLASGNVVAGYAGTPRRTAPVCIGAAVERARQLAARAVPGPSSVFVDAATRSAVAGRIDTEEVVAGAATASVSAAPVYVLKPV